MLFLLAVPIFCGVALGHRYLQIHAPSNVLIRKVRGSAPGWRTAAGLVAMGAFLLLLTHALAEAIAVGAPAWLNLVVLLLAWDAIKVECLAMSVGLRALGVAGRRVSDTVLNRSSRLPAVDPCSSISRVAESSAARSSEPVASHRPPPTA